jgi:hypothetical protein
VARDRDRIVKFWGQLTTFCNSNLNFSDYAYSGIDGFRYPVAGIITGSIDIDFGAVSRISWQKSP